MLTIIVFLQESLTQDYDAKYWRQRYSLKDGIPSFLANIAGTILTTGKYLNVMRECGHTVQVFCYDSLGLPVLFKGKKQRTFWSSIWLFWYMPLTRFLLQVPVSENSKLMSFGSNHHYLECIKAAYDFASSELLNLIKEKVRFCCHH